VGGLQNHLNGLSGVDIYQKIKEDILSLKLVPGQMISENEIAAIYNVSRTPIKTAFLRLQGEKYIQIIPQKGSFVTLLDMKFIKDIIYMRSVLEVDAMSTIIEQKLTDEVVARLNEILERQNALINSDELSPASFYEVDSEFHHCLFLSICRERMWDVIQDCQVYYSRFRILDTLTTKRYYELYNEHVRMVTALKDQNMPELKNAVFEHLHGNLRSLAEKINSEYSDYFTHYD